VLDLLHQLLRPLPLPLQFLRLLLVVLKEVTKP